MKRKIEMISFESDYIAGAHPAILERLIATNMEATPGYGSDAYSASAKEKIKEACGKPEAEVHFLVGGTQTNQVVISTVLNNYEGVVSVKTGHVNAHEAGAIEYTGHKVMEIDGVDGKMTAEGLKKCLATFYADDNQEHMVYPGMAYISYPTEYGTIYTKKELEALYAVCKEYDIPLFVDGARLAYGLASKEADITLKDLTNLCDVFYIGGTKAGAFFGEAVVFTHGNSPKHFLTQTKQHGALLAKGRLLGIQFDTLFTDDLYFKIGKHAIDKAEELKAILKEKNYRFFLETATNQQFIILENSKYKELSETVAMSFWEAYDENHTVLRLATSWSTTDEDMNMLKKYL